MSKEPYELPPRCDYCGRFFRWDEGDQYTSFGGPTDLEPPDPTLQCGACSREDEEDMVRRGTPDSSWQKSNASRRAAERLGFSLAGPVGAAWSLWFKRNEPLPKGYYWWDNP